MSEEVKIKGEGEAGAYRYQGSDRCKGWTRAGWPVGTPWQDGELYISGTASSFLGMADKY
jgi:hypothetical protein